jgi:hypothetical protein
VKLKGKDLKKLEKVKEALVKTRLREVEEKEKLE